MMRGRVNIKDHCTREGTHGHEIQKLGVTETHAGEDFKRRARNTTLVRTRVPEEDDALLLQRETGGLHRRQSVDRRTRR